MAVCFEKKFPFDPEGNFKDVEIEAKNGDLGLGNGHGSKRSLFVTEDFAEEEGELQRTRWCTLRELRTRAFFENVSAPSFHFSLNLVGGGG